MSYLKGMSGTRSQAARARRAGRIRRGMGADDGTSMIAGGLLDPTSWGSPPTTQSTSSGGTGVLDVLKSIGGALLGGLTGSARAQGQAAAYQQQLAAQQTPSWVMPVAIGGVGLLAVILLTRK